MIFNLDWVKISIISKTKFVQNILIWIILVPILVKTFKNINEVCFTINDVAYIINLSLPFSLGIFYFSALFFLLGNILYKIFVPQIIDDNKSFTSFHSDGKGKIQLIKYYEEGDIKNENDYVSLYIDENIERNEMSEIFWEIWELSLDKNKIIRFIISLFYCFAILLIIVTFIQNICYVILEMNLINSEATVINFIINIGK